MNADLRAEIIMLNHQFRELSDLVLNQIRLATEAAASGKAEATMVFAEFDKEIHRRGIQIQRKCLEFLSLSTPIADERRYVFTVAKVNHEMERIGELARKVATEATTLSLGWIPSTARDIALLARLAYATCSRAIMAFVTKDTLETLAVWEDGATIDDIYSRLYSRFEEALAMPNVGIRPLLAAQSVVFSLGQVSDHAMRIANMVPSIQFRDLTVRSRD